jgi:hypothetical protein
MKSILTPALGLGLLMSALLNAQPAYALSFKGDGAKIWVARTHSFVEAMTSEGVTGTTLFERPKTACQGISGELFQIGGIIPVWAAESHRSFCRGIDSFYGKRNIRKACGDIKSAIGYLENAKPEKAPEEVVAVATDFRKSLELFINEAKKQELC